MSSIALAPSLALYFEEAVGAAVKSRQVEVTEGAKAYLVGLLSEFAHPDPLIEDSLDRPLVFLLHEALRLNGAERFQRLRALGDAALYVSGFFADHIENRGMPADYVARVGATAYGGAAAMLGKRARVSERAHSEGACGRPDTRDRSEPVEGRKRAAADDDVLGELASHFGQYVEVLEVVADTALASQAHGERGLLRLYERWLRSGSTTLASELCARGLVPARGVGGIH